METKMTPELQEAYNEWLLLFGYREVERKALQEANTILYSHMSAEKARSLTHWPHKLQLKTLEEL